MEKQEKLFNANFIFLLLGCFLAFTAYNGYYSVFPLYVLDGGGTRALVGTMGTALSISSIVTRLVCGYLQDRYGRKVILLVGAIAYTINLFSYAFIHDMTSIFLLRILCGIGQGMYFGATGTLVSDVVPKKRLVEGLSYYGMSASIAGIFAPSVGASIYNNWGAIPMFLAVGICSTLGVLAMFFVKAEHTPVGQKADGTKGKRKIGITNFFDVSVIMPSLITFFLFLAYSSISNFLTAYGKEMNLTNVSLFFTFYGIANMSIRLFAGPVIKMLGRSRIILYSILSFVVCYLCVAKGDHIGLIILAGAICGLAFGLAGPLLNAIVFELVPDERKGVANSTYAMMGDMGSGLGAFVWGLVAQGISYSAVFVGAALCAIPALVIHVFKIVPDKRLQ